MSLLATAMVTAFLYSEAAQAQQIETVIVTAEKRSENVQNVPIAITAFSGDAIQQKGIGDLHGLSNLTPNVNLDSGAPFSGDSSVLSASIRGIGQDDFAFNLDPGVGVYVDGVYYARTIGANVDLLDVERIEILKGPQGTLFGRNTIGGAISIVTRDPGDKFMVQAQITGGSFNRRDIALTADIPISDTVKTSITVQSVERDGYQRVVPYNNVAGYVFDPVSKDFATPNEFNNRLGGQNRQSIRGKLTWDIDADFEMMVTADWTHQDQSSIPNTVLQVFPNTPNAGGSIAGLYMACIAGATIGHLCDAPRATGWPITPGGLPPLNTLPNLVPISPETTQAHLVTGDIDTTYANGPNYAKFDSEGAGVTFTYQLAPDMTLKSITGYRHITWNIGIDLDGAADHGNLLEVTDKQQQQQFTQELQLIGTAFDSRLSYVAGLFYFYEDGFVHDWVPFDGDLLAVEDSGLNLVRTSSYAAFAHADYKLTDQIGLTLGARYSVEDKFFVGGQQDLNGLAYKASGCYPPTASGALIGAPAFLTCQQVLGFPDPTHPFLYFPPGANHQAFYAFTPTAGIQYHVTDDAMAYFSWSKGTKSGGWTTRLSNPIADATLAEFKPEKATTYEVGLKAEWFDSTLQTNIALFYTDYSNIQLNQQQGASPVLKNLGDAEIYGAEFEGQAIFGHGFSAHAAIGYLDAHYTSLDPSIHPVVPDPFSDITLHSKLPKTPMWKININPEWDHDLGNGQAIQVQVSYTHTSSMFNDSLNTPLLMRPSLDLFDASVRFSFGEDKYSIAVGGTNLTDKRYITVGSVNYAAGFVDGTYSPPAQWYARFNIKM
ncbi:MAG: TonB-dependent receptor [Rhizomicrobium sp.]